jgi:hypothetical protein
LALTQGKVRTEPEPGSSFGATRLCY